MVKLTKRKGFNFFRSYFDVYNELESAQDKVDFIDALLNRQFLGVKPTELKGMAKFAYISQTNSIDSQVKGYEDKTKDILNPCQPPTVGVNKNNFTPALQVEVEEKEKEQYNSKEIAGVVYDLTSVEGHKEYYNVLIKNMNKEHTWLESLYRNEKISKGKLGKLVDLFIIHLMSKEVKDRPDTLSKFKQHCAAWIRLKFRMGDFQEYSSIKPKGSI